MLKCFFLEHKTHLTEYIWESRATPKTPKLDTWEIFCKVFWSFIPTSFGQLVYMPNICYSHLKLFLSRANECELLKAFVLFYGQKTLLEHPKSKNYVDKNNRNTNNYFSNCVVLWKDFLFMLVLNFAISLN